MRIKSVEHISELSESNAGVVVVFKSLRDVRIKNLNRIVLAHLNINSLRNKFDLLTDQIKGNVDVLVISETRLDDSFPTGQNNMPFFNKELSGAHKKRTQLRNRFLKKNPIKTKNFTQNKKNFVFLYLEKQKDVTMLILIIKT